MSSSRDRTTVEFGLLGPLLVRSGHQTRQLASARQRVLLAVMLLRRNQIVSADELVEAVWDGRPPPRARTTLQSYVMRLRRALGPEGAPRLVTRPPGYLIRVGDDELDLAQFRARQACGRAAASQGNWPLAAAQFADALALWRGEPLLDIPSDLLRQHEAHQFAEMHTQTVEQRIDADLQLGRHERLLGELPDLVRCHPLRERFRYQLMLALHSCGRRADALAAYRDARRVLVEELGVEPGSQLQDLHRRMLTEGGVARQPTPACASVEVAGRAPAALPAGVAGFVGRHGMVGQIADLLGVGAPVPDAVAPVAITGAPGIGKTALALHAAHRLRGHFIDGQLYADLRGTADPVPPGRVLDQFLRVLGVDASSLAQDDEAKAAAYRTAVSGRQLLVVLDDARGAAQVRPLLPGSPTCQTLVTSRDRLTGLAGRRAITLGPLDGHEAHLMFTAIVGVARVSAEPDRVSDVLGCCGGLPLAIWVAAAQLTGRPEWTVGHLAGRLADEGHRLDTLCAGEVAVRAAFESSYRGLPGPLVAGTLAAAEVFATLGRWPGELSLSGAARRCGVAEALVEPGIEALVDAHLLDSPAPARYRMSDLLRLFAREKAVLADAGYGGPTATGRAIRQGALTGPAEAVRVPPEPPLASDARRYGGPGPGRRTAHRQARR